MVAAGVGQSGEQSLKRIETASGKASGGLTGLGRQAELLRTGIRTLGGALAGVATVGGLTALVDRSISAANAIGKTADTIGVGVEALAAMPEGWDSGPASLFTGNARYKYKLHLGTEDQEPDGLIVRKVLEETRTPRAVRGRLLACLEHSGGDQHQRPVRHLPLGLGFSTSQDFNGDIALIACFASSWTPAMVRRWHAEPFGSLRPWNEVPALMGSGPPATPPSTGTGVITFLMG